MPRQILFVDDEPMLLSGLKRSLHAMRQEWEMTFVSGGQEALQAMAEHPYDIIVTDMQMPVMNGAQLLEEVKNKYPQCLRFVLSGQANRDTILKTVNPAHQFLSKPCDSAELKRRLTRALAIRNLLQNEELRELVSKLESLPTLPTLYADLIHELDKDEPSVARIGQLVSEDMALTAKILQLVNVSNGGFLSQDGQAVALVHREDEALGQSQITATRPPGAGGVSGQGAVVTMTFEAKATGQTPLTITRGGARDPGLQAITVNGAQAAVTVQ